MVVLDYRSRGGSASLHVANDGAATAGPTGAPASPSESATPSPTPSPSNPLDVIPLPGWPTPSQAPKPTPSPTGSEKPRPHPTATPSPSPTDPPAQYTYLAGAAPDSCSTAQGAQSAPDTENWCAVYAGEPTLERNAAAMLPFRLCRSSDLLAGTGTLTSAQPGHWLKARAIAADESVPWAWSGQSLPVGPITVSAGDCVQWVVPWDVAVDPGTYRLNAVFIVEEYKPHPSDVFTVEVVR